MYTSTIQGYEVNWTNKGKSNISRISYDGVEFLDIRIEYFYRSNFVKITCVITDSPNPMAACPSIVMTSEFADDLFECFNIDVKNVRDISKDPERFLLNVMRVTSDSHHWSRRLDTFLKSQPQKLKKTKVYKQPKLQYPDNIFGENVKQYDIDSLKYKDAEIKKLREEIVSLKEEIEDLKKDLVTYIDMES